MVPRLVTQDESFVVRLDRLVISEEEVRGLLLCVQFFVRKTQSSVFNYFGAAILSESAAIADKITNTEVYAPWSHVGSVSASQIVSDLRA